MTFLNSRRISSYIIPSACLLMTNIFSSSGVTGLLYSISESKAGDLFTLLPRSPFVFVSSKSFTGSRVLKRLEDLWLALDISYSAKHHVASASLNWRALDINQIVFQGDSSQGVRDLWGFFAWQSFVGQSSNRGGVTSGSVTHMRRDLRLCQNWRISSVWQLTEWLITPPIAPFSQWNERTEWKRSLLIQ